ncbi:MAG: hypothetical protein QOF94_657 [Acidobacteriaceae bacterium]
MISRQPPIYMVSFTAIGNAKWERNCEAERPDEPWAAGQPRAAAVPT